MVHRTLLCDDEHGAGGSTKLLNGYAKLGHQGVVSVHRSILLAKSTTLWLVRHGEREDHIDPDWHSRYSHLAADNPPLSKRGRVQADEAGFRLKNVHFDHVFVSPYDRCLETATRIIGDRPLKMKVERGFIESLGYCEDPPGHENFAVIKKKYPPVDHKYVPLRYPLAGKEPITDDAACRTRVRLNLEAILRKYRGSILIVTHNDVIAAVHDFLCGGNVLENWRYVGLATISKFVEKKRWNFECELTGDFSHLSDPTNLRI